MAKRPSVTSIRSKQGQVLRYVASTNLERAAKDLGVSTAQLKSFVTASPEKVKQNRSQYYTKLVASTPSEIAKKQDVTLVQRLSGKRLARAYTQMETNEQKAKSVRYTQVVRQRRRVVKDGVIHYELLKDVNKTQSSRKQILENMGGTTAKSVMNQYEKGIITEEEARTTLRKLWQNSGLSPKAADDYFDKHSE